MSIEKQMIHTETYEKTHQLPFCDAHHAVSMQSDDKLIEKKVVSQKQDAQVRSENQWHLHIEMVFRTTLEFTSLLQQIMNS